MSIPKFKPGDLVHHVVTVCHEDEALDYDTVECGVVVLVQASTDVSGAWDCFAACFEPGHKPQDVEHASTDKPYILRYFDTEWLPGWPHRPQRLTKRSPST